MAALDDAMASQTSHLNDLALVQFGLLNGPMIKQYVYQIMWALFKAYPDVKITSIGFWFIHKTIRVRDLRPFLEWALGAPPAGV